MSKPKLLIYADAGQPTGFEKITRGLATNLMDYYDLTVAGIGYYGQRDVAYYTFPVIPATLNPSKDFMGLGYFNNILEETEPDVILFIQDVWNVLPLAAKKPIDLPSVIYTLPDSPNLKWIYGFGLGLHSNVVTPTHFGARELVASVQSALTEMKPGLSETEPTRTISLKDSAHNVVVRLDRLAAFQNETNINVVPIGINPVPDIITKAKAREQVNLPKDAFIILNVNTNSFRKRLDLTLVAFSRVLDFIPDAHLVLHAQGDQTTGWDLKQLIKLLNLTNDNITIFTDKLTEIELFMLYKCADVQINTSTGEGWGLPAIEGWQVGVPQLVPDWSATREIWSEDARIRTKPHGFHYSNVNTMHGRISVSDLVNKICNLSRLRTNPVITLREWPSIAAEFNIIIKHALNEPPMREMTLSQVFNERLVHVESEAVKQMLYL
jgi:glycosyltransferase involved in cell wall biosynthesis